MMPENYLEINKASWNQKVDPHLQSDFYAHDAFLKGKTTLKKIELDLLGDVSGKKILHLQCHFGQDSLSLARMGGKVTGVDFSEKAIEVAQQTNQDLGLDATFICCDIYSLPDHLVDEFDIVFTTYGTIGWLPDIKRWADVVAKYLKPGGEFIFADFHPVIWMYDNHFNYVQYSYFHDEAIMEEEEGSYADNKAPIKTKTIGWNHGLGEVLTALLSSQLTILDVQEYNYSPYGCFNHSEKIEEDYYLIPQFGNKIPYVYSIKAKK